jgi:inhibitor of KinA
VQLSSSFSIFPLGDSAITIDLGNCIDEQLNIRALAIQDWLLVRREPGFADIITAYSSVSVFYDPTLIPVNRRDGPGGVYHWLKGLLEQAWEQTSMQGGGQVKVQSHDFRIPVCYEGEYGPDLKWVAEQKDLSTRDIIALHSSQTYRIFMIGFLPGFPYMGKIDRRLEISRKQRPVPVLAGGVGIAGIQTGIYPLNSPGGWQIIGRTPVKLFNRQAQPPVRMRPGDLVQFYPVSPEEFRDWKI